MSRILSNIDYNIYFILRYGLANAINTYSMFKKSCYEGGGGAVGVDVN